MAWSSAIRPRTPPPSWATTLAPPRRRSRTEDAHPPTSRARLAREPYGAPASAALHVVDLPRRRRAGRHRLLRQQHAAERARAGACPARRRRRVLDEAAELPASDHPRARLARER